MENTPFFFLRDRLSRLNVKPNPLSLVSMIYCIMTDCKLHDDLPDD